MATRRGDTFRSGPRALGMHRHRLAHAVWCYPLRPDRLVPNSGHERVEVGEPGLYQLVSLSAAIRMLRQIWSTYTRHASHPAVFTLVEILHPPLVTLARVCTRGNAWASPALSAAIRSSSVARRSSANVRVNAGCIESSAPHWQFSRPRGVTMHGAAVSKHYPSRLVRRGSNKSKDRKKTHEHSV